MGAQAAYVIGNIAPLPGVGSVLNIGLAYAVGLGVGLVVALGTSGAHFSPSITIVRILFEGFPIFKGIRFIIAQILGAFLAALLVYVQWHDLISATEAGLMAAGKYDAINFTPQGVAGIFALYVLPGSHLGNVFLNEFVSDFVLGLAIYACLDPTNVLVPPAASPWIIAVAFAMAIWGFSPVGLAANPARDIGGRLAALCIWGTKANGGSYAAIAALTSIPATIVAYIAYEMFFVDSSRGIDAGHREFLTLHIQHLEKGEEASIEGSTAMSDLEKL